MPFCSARADQSQPPPHHAVDKGGVGISARRQLASSDPWPSHNFLLSGAVGCDELTLRDRIWNVQVDGAAVLEVEQTGFVTPWRVRVLPGRLYRPGRRAVALSATRRRRCRRSRLEPEIEFALVGMGLGTV